MAVIQHPHPCLRQVAAEVHAFDDNLMALVHEMQQEMQDGLGGVGIAAPQLAVSQRVVLVDCSLGKHACKHHGRVLMVNPVLVASSGKALGREGCLSVPDWVATVQRARKITVHYQDEQGTPHELHASGFEARVIQHEIDHLDGVLFIDRVASTHDLMRRL